jgi:hypothetical protein
MALLAGIQATEVVEPLSQFQHTSTDRSQVFKLIKDLNELLPDDRRLAADRLTRAFDSYWGGFEGKLVEAIASTSDKAPSAPARETGDMVAELLELVREMKRELSANREHEVQMERNHAMELRARLVESETRAAIMREHELHALRKGLGGTRPKSDSKVKDQRLGDILVGKPEAG